MAVLVFFKVINSILFLFIFMLFLYLMIIYCCMNKYRQLWLVIVCLKEFLNDFLISKITSTNFTKLTRTIFVSYIYHELLYML